MGELDGVGDEQFEWSEVLGWVVRTCQSIGLDGHALAISVGLLLN